jgi:hypothetical protein
MSTMDWHGDQFDSIALPLLPSDRTHRTALDIHSMEGLVVIALFLSRLIPGWTFNGPMTESWITKCGSCLIYVLLPGKEILYVIPISSILPTVHAGDTGAIPHLYRGTNRFNRHIARADSSSWSGDGSPMYFVNSWALGWAHDMWIKGICWDNHWTDHTDLWLICYNSTWYCLKFINMLR